MIGGMVADNHSSASAVENWPAPTVARPISVTVTVPGSKSMTNRALILSALAEYPSEISGALRSRDSDLMIRALRHLGCQITESGPELEIKPAPFHGASIHCGLAGTVMRFVPPAAALANGTVFFDGDAQARLRPMSTMLDALSSLGVEVTGTHLPFSLSNPQGVPAGGLVELDASASSQFVSGLLLSAARYAQGMTVRHVGGRLPSMPHIEMTVAMLRLAGVEVLSGENEWTVRPGPIAGRHWVIEPDLSNATPFLAAAAVTGGTMRIPHWPLATTQPGDAMRHILEEMGCQVELVATGAYHTLQVTGPAAGQLKGITIDMSDIGELTPTVAALATLATTPSTLDGIAHLRGHETDRLAALAQEINRIGGKCTELADGLYIEPVAPAQLHGAVWHSYADHRMATAGAIIGLRVPGIEVENIGTTSKTLPGFDAMWAAMLEGTSA